LALILTVFTALVAPACKVPPMTRRMMPGTNSALEPSMISPTRPRTYGGVQTTAPMAPPTAEAASLSRFGVLVLMPMIRAGTAT